MIKLTEKLEGLVRELKKTQPETFYHSLHVKKLVSRMLLKMNCAGVSDYQDREIEYICKGALLHDIGKLYVNNAFLTKPSALQEDEMDNLRQHTKLGAEAVQDELYGEEKTVIWTICRYHHERIDGSGYEGKTDIPLYLQVVSVCDVFDALHTDRVYRAGRPAEEIYPMLREGACGKFDDTLLAYLEETVEMNEGAKSCGL